MSLETRELPDRRELNSNYQRIKWKVDPLLKLGEAGLRGQAPEGHPRRCQAPSKNSGRKQCSQWASIGSHYCRYHGGRAKVYKKPKKDLPMAGIYSSVVSGTLRDRLLELEKQTPEERIDLTGEVDVLLEVARQSLITYQAIVIDGKLDKKDEETGLVEKNLKARAAAKACMENAFVNVQRMKESAAKIKESWVKTDILKKSNIPAANLPWLEIQWVQATAKLLQDLLPGDENQYKRDQFIVKLSAELKSAKVFDQNPGQPKVVINID